jgi:hypothetical protein
MFQELENLLQNFEGRQKGVFLIARKTFVEAFAIVVVFCIRYSLKITRSLLYMYVSICYNFLCTLLLIFQN